MQSRSGLRVTASTYASRAGAPIPRSMIAPRRHRHRGDRLAGSAGVLRVHVAADEEFEWLAIKLPAHVLADQGQIR